MKLMMKLIVLPVLMIGLGCTNESAAPKKDEKAPKEKPPDTTAKIQDHSGWWCDEHGIPEEECSMCDPKVYKAFKAKGDICDKHPDRAKSQCFICNPELKKPYDAKYRAKYGKEPPDAEANK